MIVTDDDANRCPACGGNDRDMPCAYPGEGEGELRQLFIEIVGREPTSDSE